MGEEVPFFVSKEIITSGQQGGTKGTWEIMRYKEVNWGCSMDRYDTYYRNDVRLPAMPPGRDRHAGTSRGSLPRSSGGRKASGGQG
jgi:hypothetical protein